MSTINEKEIDSSLIFKSFIMALKYGNRKKIIAKLPEIIRLFNKSNVKEQEYLSVALIYIESIIPAKDRQMFLETIKQEYYNGVYYMKSVVDSLREEGFVIGIKEGKKVGKEEGKKVGKEEGKKVGKKEGKEIQKQEDQIIYAKRMIDKNMDSKNIHAITGLSISKIESMKRKKRVSDVKTVSNISKRKTTFKNGSI